VSRRNRARPETPLSGRGKDAEFSRSRAFIAFVGDDRCRSIRVARVRVELARRKGEDGEEEKKEEEDRGSGRGRLSGARIILDASREAAKRRIM